MTTGDAVSAWLGRQTLRLYPIAYRRRYGDEMHALLEDRPAGPGTVLDLLRGALIAHVRGGGALTGPIDPADRVRAMTSGVLVCWLVFVVALFGFLKTTENHPYFGDAPPLANNLQVATQALAVIGSVAVVLGGLPLILGAIAYAREPGDVRRRVALPFAAVILFAALTGLVIAIARTDAPLDGVVADLGLAVVWAITSVGCGATFVLATRAAVPVAPARLSVAVVPGTLVTIAMVAFAAAGAIHGVALAADASELGGDPNGPFGLLSVSAWLIVEVTVMVAAAALATLATLRGWRGDRELAAA
jgi:hypothetical protein